MTAERTVRKIETLDCNAEYSTFNIILNVRGNIYNQRFPTGTFIEKKLRGIKLCQKSEYSG